MVDRVEVEISVKNNTKQGLDNIRDDLEGFKNRMQSEEALGLSVNLAKIRQELKNINTIIKENEKAGLFDININAKAELLKQQVTAAQRELRNFTRTGEKEVSVLGKLFGGVGEKIGVLSGGLKGFASSIATSFSSIGGIIGGLFGITAISAFGKKLIGLGSDLNELQSKFNTTFSGIQEQGNLIFNNLSSKLGRSQLDLKNYGSTLGNILQPLGFTTQESLNLSAALTELAIDVASFNNVSDTQAINAFRGAVTGEREALKSLGIVLLDADIKQNAYKNGIAKVGSELTKQQQALSTYQLLLKNTSNAQGDAVRTGDSFANQLKRLQGIITDTMAQAGLDIANSTSSILSQLGTLVQAYGSSLIEVGVNTIKIIGNTVGLAISGFTQLYNELNSASTESTQSQLSNIGLLAKGFQILGLGIQGVITIIQTVGIMLGGILSDGYEAIKFFVKAGGEVFKSLGTIVSDVMSGIWNNIKFAFKSVINDLIGQLNTFIGYANKALGKVGLSIGTVDYLDVGKAKSFSSILKGIGSNLTDLSKNTKPILDSFLAGFGKGTGKETTNQIKDLWTNLGAGAIAENEKIQKNFSIQTGQQKQQIANEQNKLKLKQDQINKEKELQNLIDKYSKEIGTKVGKGKSSEQIAKEELKKKQEQLKKEQEEQIKILEENANKEIELIRKSEATENEKAKKILEVTQKLEDDKKSIQGKTIELQKQRADEILKKVEKNKDEEVKKYEDVGKKIEDGADKLEKYGEKIVDIGKKIGELKDGAIKDIREINNSLTELDKEQSTKLLDRRLELLNEQKQIQDKINESIKKGEPLTYEETLKANEELNKIKNELLFIEGKTTEEQRKQSDILAQRTEAQKIVDEIEAKKKSLQEQKGIANAIVNERQIQIDEENGILKGFYVNEKGEQIAITDFKNLEYARDLANKQATLNAQLEAEKLNYQKQVEELRIYNSNRLLAEQEYTKNFGVEIEKRKQMIDSLKTKLEAVKSLNEQLELAKKEATKSTTTTTSTTVNRNIGAVNVYNQVDMTSLDRRLPSSQ